MARARQDTERDLGLPGGRSVIVAAAARIPSRGQLGALGHVHSAPVAEGLEKPQDELRGARLEADA